MMSLLKDNEGGGAWATSNQYQGGSAVTVLFQIPDIESNKPLFSNTQKYSTLDFVFESREERIPIEL